MNMTDGKEVKEAILQIVSKEIADEFELLSITEADDLVRQIARKIRDRLEMYAGMLEFIIQPDQTVSAMNEYSFFNEEEHQKIVDVYRKLMSILRAYLVADLESGDSFKEYIVTALAQWSELKDPILHVVKKLQSGWELQQTLHVERGYLG